MSVTDSLKSTLSQYATFTGRASQREWAVWFVANFAIGIVLGALPSLTMSETGSSPVSILSGIYGLAIFIPNLAVMVRRFHDQDRSGWFVLLSLIPFVGSLIVLVMLFMSGSPGPNKYGLAPADQA